MGNVREKYNAKARRSSSKPSKRIKHSASKLEENVNVVEDVNAPIIVPKTKEQKDIEKKERLTQELLEQSESKMTGKKKKRLEKYIEKKLKKDERVHVMDKLAKSQVQLSTTLQLHSSSTLGSRRNATNEERLAKLEDMEIRRALKGKGKRRRDGLVDIDSDSATDGDDEGDMDVDSKQPTFEAEPCSSPVVILDEKTETKSKHEHNTGVGSALQRNPDGTVKAPRVVPRKPKGNRIAFRSWDRMPGKSHYSKTQDCSSSFNSSDSDNDSPETDEGDSDSSITDRMSNVGDTDSSSSNDTENDEQIPVVTGKRKRGFKDWALKQLSVAKGYDPPPASLVRSDSAPPPHRSQNDPVVNEPSSSIRGQDNSSITIKDDVMNSSKTSETRGPLGEDLQLPTNSFAKHVQSSKSVNGSAKVVSVVRPADVQESRLLLPIVAEEQPIVEAILLNPVVIICGETGSGKTTQVPQFLYEAGFGVSESDNPGMIGITQPRRVAAMSMATRVAHELSLTSSRVSYQIRYDATTSAATSIKFMTDGVLLRELASDFLLSKYSVIVIDEAHERSVNTDILIGVLSRVLKLREEMWKEDKQSIKPLRLVIMSATLRISDFASNTALFNPPPPVINVSSRQHPVTIHFNRRTVSDYVSETIKKAAKIHARLPAGGILIFLTGQNEISGVCRKLEARFGRKAIEAKHKRRTRINGGKSTAQDVDTSETRNTASVAPAQADVEAEEMELGSQDQNDLAADADSPIGELDAEALDSDEDQALDDASLGIDTDESDMPMHILPLYSLLPSDKQMRVFETPPSDTRLVVVATNVAETSLTIPGIRYVIDCGRAKERQYDTSTGIQTFKVSWISKASAAQRAGRAGRTGPGHCYRLYSSALFEQNFDRFSQPEILRMPIEGVVLQMKSMNIDTITNFPFPTPPERTNLKKAETVLGHIGALTPSKFVLNESNHSTSLVGGHITELGKAMALFPLSPRFARMLVSGRQHGCLPYVIAIVSALSVGDPFIREENLDQSEDDFDDEAAELSHLKNTRIKAKETNKLRRKAFFNSQEIHSKLGNASSDVFSLLSVVGAYEYAGGGYQFCADQFVRPKAMEEIHKLRAQISNIVQTNFPDVTASFVSDLRPPSDLQLKVLKQLICSAFIDQVAVRKDIAERGSSTGTKYTTSRGIPYQAFGVAEDVFIHPSSILFGKAPPEYIVFNEIVRSSRLWIKILTVVNPAWLATLGKSSLCTFSKPTKNNSGELMVVPHFGPSAWELPPISAAKVLLINQDIDH